MTSSTPQLQQVSWNSLHCTIPGSWQTIVKNHSHLIFEQNLSPLLEIRWNRPTRKTSPEKQVHTVFNRLQKESGGTLIPLPQPAFFEKLKHNYQTTFFGHINREKPNGALIVCRRCNLLILANFFINSSSVEETLSMFFDKLDCHSYLEGNRLWKIQDCSFMLPANFSLDSFSFSFGLSKISFKNKTTRLHLCRLAPASEHLDKTSFTELFSTFSNSKSADHVSVKNSILLFSHNPRLREKYIAYLTRKKPYKWAVFNHFKNNDRILGAFAESSAPLAQTCIDTIRSSYTIV